jgi:Mg-chelatase subunit ChlD
LIGANIALSDTQPQDRTHATACWWEKGEPLAYGGWRAIISYSFFLFLSTPTGVANNNLGTMVLQEQMESVGTDRLFDNSLFGVCISEIYFVGIGYFDEAIRNGSFEYELAKDTDDKGPYAKQLSNRHFNRGMFLVVVRHHPLCPTWINEDGVADILKAKQLDEEVVRFWSERGLLEENEVQEFESIMRRARGILSLMRNYKFQDPWGIDSLIEKAETMINEAKHSSSLFKQINRIGRLQQIDDLRIQHALCKDDYLAAGKIAMRMLVEDEYIIDTVIVNALTAVNQYFKSEKIRIATINATQYLQRETRRAQVNVLREPKNVFFCLDYSGSMAGERMAHANKNLRWVFDEHCSDKDMVGFIRFNHDIDDQLWFPLGKKGDYKDVQEAILSRATDAEGGTRLYAALNRCITQILSTETKNDTWIVALTDGESSWDHPAKKVVERIKQANKQRNVKIHVVIIGFEVPSSMIKTCDAVTSVTDKSLYIDARGGLDEMDKAFEQVVSVIGGSAITMETF